MSQPYIAVAQIWKTETETIPVPVLGVFPDVESAQANAYAVITHILTTDAPALLECPVTVTATAIPDESVREFLRTLQRTRPDLMRR